MTERGYVSQDNVIHPFVLVGYTPSIPALVELYRDTGLMAKRQKLDTS
jgi:hypothetical protein